MVDGLTDIKPYWPRRAGQKPTSEDYYKRPTLAMNPGMSGGREYVVIEPQRIYSGLDCTSCGGLIDITGACKCSM